MTDTERLDAGRELDERVAVEVLGGWARSDKWVAPYSVSIEDAWQVVEHLVGRGYWFTMWTGRPHLDQGFIVRMGRLSESRECAEGTADTFPLAICIAALRAAALEREGEGLDVPALS